jgi:protein O-GlcNAc transferase
MVSIVISLEPESVLREADILQRQGRLAEAEALYERLLDRLPRDPRLLNGLGSIKLRTGRPEEAVKLLGMSLDAEPNQPAIWVNRGIALAHMKRWDEALESFDQATALQPDYAEAYNNRGAVLQNLERFEDALASFDRAIALNPDFAVAHKNRGNALASLDRLEDALGSYDRAVAAKPDFATAYLHRGNVLKRLERFDEAIASYDRVIALNPDHAAAHNNRGAVFHALRRFDQALASYDQAIRCDPNYGAAYNNRGIVLQDLARFDEALASYERATLVQPDSADAYCNLGALLSMMGRHEEAARAFARLVELAPDRDYAIGDLLHERLHVCDWTRYTETVDAVVDAVRAGRHASSPFTLLAVSDSPADQLRCARLFASRHYPSRRLPGNPGRRPHERIRLAYVSGDFRDHPMAYLTAGLFEIHDRSRFETYAYSFGPAQDSPMRERLIGAFDHFTDVHGASDRAVAERLQMDEIDIAVDLGGFTRGCRTAIFSFRAAPIQVSYMGYPGTMGTDYIDYIIADAHVIPAGGEAFFDENVVRLPDTYWVTDYPRHGVVAPPPRRALGLPDSAFIYCCFNNTYKITPAIFDIWMRLLKRVDNSVLWLLQTGRSAGDNLRLEARRRGVAPERLIFAARAPLAVHLARQSRADLFLDTLPCNAHTTASDALWAGLPVLTCSGHALAGRVAGSLLQAIGLPELVTDSLEAYERLAHELATSPKMLEDIKVRLGRNRSRFPLFDTERFRRHIESAYLTMWERHQRGEPPAPFAVRHIDPDVEIGP